MSRITYLLLLLTACTVDSNEDERDDSFTSGKADTGGISEGSPEASGVLRVANERTAQQMIDHGVGTNAARNIVAVRKGDDEQVGTGDDIEFATLAELDAVAYVGPQAFARLLAYADELGYLAPAVTPISPPVSRWDVASCPPMTWAQLVARFPMGSTNVEIGQFYAIASRHRSSCNDVTGCAAWVDGGATLQKFNEISGWESIEIPTGTIDGTVSLHLNTIPSQMSLSMEPSTWWSGFLHYECDGIRPESTAPIRCENTYHIGFAPNEELELLGTICASGNFHFVSSHPADTSNSSRNLNQVALFGQL